MLIRGAKHLIDPSRDAATPRTLHKGHPHGSPSAILNRGAPTKAGPVRLLSSSGETPHCVVLGGIHAGAKALTGKHGRA